SQKQVFTQIVGEARTVNYTISSLFKMFLLFIVACFAISMLIFSINAAEQDLPMFILCMLSGVAIIFSLWGLLNGLIKFCDYLLAKEEKRKWKQINK
ncbi:hypothetical protein, partial [Glaesserella parasuis]